LISQQPLLISAELFFLPPSPPSFLRLGYIHDSWEWRWGRQPTVLREYGKYQEISKVCPKGSAEGFVWEFALDDSA
jgi:hypothetical protein